MNKLRIMGIVMASMLMLLTSCGNAKDDTQSGGNSGASTSQTTDSEIKKSTSENNSAETDDLTPNAKLYENYGQKCDGEKVVMYKFPSFFNNYFKSCPAEFLLWSSSESLDVLGKYNDSSYGMNFFAVGPICGIDNNIIIDANDPDSWLDKIQNELAVKIGKSMIYSMYGENAKLNIDKKDLVDLNGMTFVNFQGTFTDNPTNPNESRDISFAGYITVIKGDSDIKWYSKDNVAGFITAMDTNCLDMYVKNANLGADKTGMDIMNEYSKNAAQSLTVCIPSDE